VSDKQLHQPAVSLVQIIAVECRCSTKTQTSSPAQQQHWPCQNQPTGKKLTLKHVLICQHHQI